jgi:hypothetical protein
MGIDIPVGQASRLSLTSRTARAAEFDLRQARRLSCGKLLTI